MQQQTHTHTYGYIWASIYTIIYMLAQVIEYVIYTRGNLIYFQRKSAIFIESDPGQYSLLRRNMRPTHSSYVRMFCVFNKIVCAPKKYYYRMRVI